MVKRNRKKSGLTPFTVILLIFLAVYVVSLVVPLLWALMTSLKEQSDFRLNIIGLPKEWAWEIILMCSANFLFPSKRIKGRHMSVWEDSFSMRFCTPSVALLPIRWFPALRHICVRDFLINFPVGFIRR